MTSALMEHSSVGSLLTTRRQAREERRRQKRIVIFCNGDIFFKGKKLSITPNRYVSYNDLLQDLTYRMPQNLYLPNGVRQLFSPSSGRRLASVSDLRDGGAYVCAGNETFKPVKYGAAELLPWGKGAQSNSNFDASVYGGGGAAAIAAPSSSQFAGYNAFPPSKFLKRQQHNALQQQQQQHLQLQLQQKQPESSRIAALRGSHSRDDVAGDSSGIAGGVTRQPKVVTIVKDGPRPRQVVKILLNRRGVQSFQQLLADISDSFGGGRRTGRLRRLWSIAGREVRDVGDLFRDEELFVGSAGEEAMALDRVADLLDELYPGNADVKSLLRHWERRLRRQEKRRGSRGHVAPQQLPPPRVEERDSGYEEAEVLVSTPSAQQQQAGAPLRGEPLRQALAARRHSKPLPLIHEPSTQPAPPDAEEANRQQRLAEEQRLADEAATAKRDKQRRLGKQREAPVSKQQQVKGRVVLPPIQASAKEPQQAPTSDKEKKAAEKQAARKEKKAQQQQQQQQQQQEEESQPQPLPALPQIPAESAGVEKKSPHHQPKQQQQQPTRRSVTPEQPSTPAGRILSPVREEEKEATQATASAVGGVATAAATGVTRTEASLKGEAAAATTASAETPRKHEVKRAEKSTDNAASKPASAKEKAKKETQQQQQQQRQTPRKSASKKPPDNQKEAEKSSEPPAADSQRPLIRPISSSRFINERYELGKTMGDGNFAIVRACVKKESKNEYAMKVIDKSKLRGKEHMVINEVRIMKLCQHPNIVRLLEEYETRTEIYLVMELVKGGDLFDAISQVVKFNETQASHMVADMASALFYLHSRNIVHRDLKPENLLVYRSKDNKISLKLGDFGLAMEVDKPIYTVCGTPTYVAPEILEERGYGLEVDLWALGVITYILLCGFPPFRSRERRQTELFQFIKSGVFEFLSPYWDHISLSAKDLIQRLLVVDRRRRYTAVDVLCHPWVISLGGSRKLPPNLSMKEQQAKLRDQLVKQAEEGMAEFQQVKANSIYGVQANAK